jgi:hypothetical protein
MERKAWVATSLFAAFCLAGITTLVSQANFPKPALGSTGPGARGSLDPGSSTGEEVRELLPLGLEAGARAHEGAEKEPPAPDGPILRLR